MTSAPTTTPWIIRPQPRPGARLRLFCFPYAGGGAAAFRAWGRTFAPFLEVCAIQPPGREQRLSEKPFSGFVPYVESLSAALLPWLDLPYVSFGHSLGALAAFECARLLRAQGRPGPRMLFASGCRAPSVPMREERVHDLPDDLFRAELERLNGTPQEVLNHPELMELMLPLVRADFAVYESYEYRAQAPLECPIRAFGGEVDYRVTSDDLKGWGEETTGGFSLQMFPGDHFFLHAAQAEMVQAITLEMQRSLRDA